MSANITRKSVFTILKAAAITIAAAFIVISILYPSRKRATLEMDDLPVVFKNKDVVFHALDEHTWVGSGHLVYNEAVYLVEGEEKALLIDAGYKIPHLDEIVATITDKPVTLALTHNHTDHIGAAKYFDELWVGDQGGEQKIKGFRGEVNYLHHLQLINLGGRVLEVFNAPGHTAESVIFVDKENNYGFSGDAFGSTNLLMTQKMSTFLKTAEDTHDMMEEMDIRFFYPGHFGGQNVETMERVADLRTIAEDVLSGKVEGKRTAGAEGLNRVVSYNGARLTYNSRKVE